MIRRIVAYGLVFVIVGGLLAVVAGWLLVHSDPPGYTRKSDFSKAELEQHAAEFVSAQGRVANALADKSGGTPMDVTFTDAMINSQIRILPPEATSRLPDWITNPQVVFNEDNVALMAEVTYGGTTSVVSFEVVPSVTPEGDLHLELAGTKAGRLPITDSLRQQFIRQADHRLERLERKLQARPGDAPATDLTDLQSEDDRLEAEVLTVRAFRTLLSEGSATVETTRWKLRLEQIEMGPHVLRVVGRRAEPVKR